MEPIINLDDPIAKTVGRRVAPPDSLDYGLALQKTLNQLGGITVPKGVYRFRSHEEADEWLMTHLASTRRD